MIADKINREPALLEIGLENIARWMARGSDQQHKLQQWKDRIEAAQCSSEGMVALLAILREDSEEAEFEREFAPFAGVLSTVERRPFYLSCSYAH